MHRHLNLFLTDKPVAFSVSHLNSDYLDNMVIMEQVVGTLVKYGSSGVYEPYLAHKWETSSNEKEWIFYIRPNLISDDGKTITAKDFERSLKHLLKIYAKEYSPPTFNQLLGWNEFLKGQESALGVKASSNNTLVFKFSARPSGFLEFLSMPYFGYYSDSDFNGSTWKNIHKITSSAAYRVKEIADFKVILEAREGWFSLNSKSPKSIAIQFSQVDEALQAVNTNPFTLISIRNGKEYNDDRFVKLKSTPTLLTALVLSPWLDPFKDTEAREAFRTIVREILLREVDVPGTQKSNYFYQVLSKLELKKMNLDEARRILRVANPKNITGFISKLTNEMDKDFILQILDKIKQEIGWSFTVSNPESIGPEWMKRALSNKEFALRVARVDIGGAPENWVINMMFCSSMGVSFPDPNDRICKIVHKYERGQFINIHDYWVAIHEAIESESIVIPVLHSGFSWLVSKEVSIDKLSPTMNLPRFDQFELVP